MQGFLGPDLLVAETRNGRKLACVSPHPLPRLGQAALMGYHILSDSSPDSLPRRAARDQSDRALGETEVPSLVSGSGWEGEETLVAHG